MIRRLAIELELIDPDQYASLALAMLNHAVSRMLADPNVTDTVQIINGLGGDVYGTIRITDAEKEVDTR